MDSVVKDEVTAITKKVCDIFTLQYTKAYVVELVNTIKLEPLLIAPPSFQLLERPPWNADLKKGWLLKAGAINKGWKKRWIVIHSNYLVDYYKSETVVNKSNGLKGTMNLAGYTVVEDPNLAALSRLKKLAEKMGVDFRNLPKPKEYPPLVFELYHPRRRCYYLKANTYDEFNEWCAFFKDVVYNVEGFTLTSDDCHKQAFTKAVRNTRWALGRWDSCTYGGSEEQILVDLIADEVETEAMGRAYAKMTGPWFMRNAMRAQLHKNIEANLASAVKPVWTGLAKGLMMRPKLETSIRDLIGPVIQFEKKFDGCMRETSKSVIDPIVHEHVVPYIGKLVNLFKNPLEQAFEECAELFCAKVSKWKPLDDLKASFVEIDWLTRSFFDMRTASAHLGAIYEPLWALNSTYKDITPWGLIWKAYSLIRFHTDKAVWTWEQNISTLIEQRKSDQTTHTSQSIVVLSQQVQDDVLAKFKSDVSIAITQFLIETVKQVVLPPFQAILVPLAPQLLTPVADLVPDPLAEFVDLQQTFEQFYLSIINESIHSVMGITITPPVLVAEKKSLPSRPVSQKPNSSALLLNQQEAAYRKSLPVSNQTKGVALHSPPPKPLPTLTLGQLDKQASMSQKPLPTPAPALSLNQSQERDVTHSPHKPLPTPGLNQSQERITPPKPLPTPGLNQSQERRMTPPKPPLPTPGLNQSQERRITPPKPPLPTPGLNQSQERRITPPKPPLPAPGLNQSQERRITPPKPLPVAPNQGHVEREASFSSPKQLPVPPQQEPDASSHKPLDQILEPPHLQQETAVHSPKKPLPTPLNTHTQFHKPLPSPTPSPTHKEDHKPLPVLPPVSIVRTESEGQFHDSTSEVSLPSEGEAEGEEVEETGLLEDVQLSSSPEEVLEQSR